MIGINPYLSWKASYIYGDENFNILELNKSTYFYHIQIDGNTVTCQHYDWTNGGVYVSNGGTFTAYDLVDNGIYGGWVTNAGTINISNYGDYQYVDLNGEITLYSGFMNVYGGYTPSYWPFAANAEINETPTLQSIPNGVITGWINLPNLVA